MKANYYFLLILIFFSCRNSSGPDVSNIKIDLQTTHFEKDFFALDSNRLAREYPSLLEKYPSFAENFLTTILNADPRWGGDTLQKYLQGFSAAYRPVYDTSLKVFSNFKPYEAEIKKGLQYVKYYFPKYVVPHKIITYIGPLDGYGDILIPQEAIIVGLHQHLGSQFSLYKTIWVQETYPDYITQRFAPGYIGINAMKNMLNDLYPEKQDERTLILQMIAKGRRLYALQMLVPAEEEFKLIGYTEKQMKESYAHEAAIWDLFVQNNFLQTLDNNIIKNYIGESPKTQELGDGSPGNIGSFSGWQLVKKYMKEKPGTTLPQLMQMSEEEILQEAKYKP
ncbi:MAG: hypothetical protein ABIT96_08545 [Ferruginibacter sp.]